MYYRYYMSFQTAIFYCSIHLLITRWLTNLQHPSKTWANIARCDVPRLDSSLPAGVWTPTERS